ncbi:MAG: hypothetical protein PHF51_02125 [Candidatus ainarchaeum sp.]|nr:hypothetical protein [Candidatus ainarchaeum sp.]
MLRDYRSIPGILLSKTLFFALFLLLLLLANALIPVFNDQTYQALVGFMLDRNNLAFIAVTWLLLLVGEVFNALPFPYSLPSPLFSATGALLLIVFVYAFISKAGDSMGADLRTAFAFVPVFVYPLVFALVLFLGYLVIMLRAAAEAAGDAGFETAFDRRRKKWSEVWSKEDERKRRAKPLGQVAGEFRETVLDAMRRARRELNKDECGETGGPKEGEK